MAEFTSQILNVGHNIFVRQRGNFIVFDESLF